MPTHALELVAEQWNAAGLNTTVKLSNRDLYWPRAIGNQVMIPVWGTGSIFPLMNPDNLRPSTRSPSGDPSTASGTRPAARPARNRRITSRKGQAIFDEILRTADGAKQAELGKELVRNATENMWVINVVGKMPLPVAGQEQLQECLGRSELFGFMDCHVARQPGSGHVLLQQRRVDEELPLIGSV